MRVKREREKKTKQKTMGFSFYTTLVVYALLEMDIQLFTVEAKEQIENEYNGSVLEFVREVMAPCIQLNNICCVPCMGE